MVTTSKPRYERLSVKLTDEERMTRALKAAELSAKYDETEDKKKDVTATLAAEMKTLREEMAGLQRAVRSGTEVQPVQVEERRNEARRTIELYRLDTEELVHSRPMTVEERQGKLFAIEGGRVEVTITKAEEPKPSETASDKPARRGRAKKSAAEGDAKGSEGETTSA